MVQFKYWTVYDSEVQLHQNPERFYPELRAVTSLYCLLPELYMSIITLLAGI